MSTAVTVRQQHRSTSVRMPTLERLQARLRCLRLSPEIWSVAHTIGMLQRHVRQRYRQLAKQYHVDLHKPRFTLEDAAQIIIDYADGCALSALARKWHTTSKVIWNVLDERQCAYHHAGREYGWTFRQITTAYHWCMALPAHAPMPLSTDQTLRRLAQQLASPLGDGGALPVVERTEVRDAAGYRIVRTSEAL